MQRKPGYTVANSMKMDIGIGLDVTREGLCDEEEPQQRRQQLINFGHTQWGFNNWSWSVTLQDLDFAEPLNGKYTAGVACYVSIKVKSLDIHRDNVGYATSIASNKGLAIHRARKCAVTNALRETLMSFGGNVATELIELLESNKNEGNTQIMVPEVVQECNQNPLHKSEPKNMAKPNIRRDTEVNIPLVYPQKGSKNSHNPPVAKAHPMPANLPNNQVNINPPATPAANLPPAANASRPPYAGAPPAPGPAPAHVRPNSNEAEDATAAAREERRRRQKQAKEDFMRKQMEQDDKQELSINGSMDLLLADIVTPENETEGSDTLLGKRKSPNSRDIRNVRSKPYTDKTQFT